MIKLMSHLLQEMKDYDDKKKGRGRGADDDTEDAIGVRKKMKMNKKGRR